MVYDFGRYDIFIQKDFEKNIERYLAFINFYLKYDLHSLYIEYVNKEAELIKNISEKKDDIYEYFAIYYCLLYLGMLSYNNNFIVSKDDKEIPIDCGLSIISGNGVCRNITKNFSSILSILDNKCVQSTAGINLFNTKVKLGNHPNIPIISKDISNGNSNNNEIITKPDHSILLVGNGIKMDLFDPTNFIITNVDMFKIDNERKIFEMRYNLLDCDFLVSYNDRINFLKKVCDVMKQFEYSKWNVYSKEYLINLRDYGYKLCMRNMDSISKFENDTKTLRREIVEKKNKIIL